MKNIALSLVLISVLAGCAIEKRHYRSGFYIFNHGAGVSCVQQLEHHPEEAPSAVFSGTPADIGFDDVSFKNSSSISLAPVKTPDVPAIKAAGKPKSSVKSEPRASKPLAPKTTSDSSGNSHLIVTLGWVCMVLAAISLFVLWPLIFFIIPGVILLIVGYSKGGGKVQKEEQLQDVVYLKNGSIVRGVIIEQVPGVSLKIKTKDGSVFFYKMEEIEKITKE